MFILWRAFLLVIFLAITSVPSWAASCPTSDPCRDKSELHERVACYTDVVNTCATQRQSMTAQVIYLSTKIELTISKIEQAQMKIKELEEEIVKLTEKIDNLENSLTRITGIFLDRVVATYKFGAVNQLYLILTAGKFSDLLNRYKYVQTVQAHDRRLLFQLQNSKINFQDQKTLREEKRKELDRTKVQLEKEQANLAVQKKEKELF